MAQRQQDIAAMQAELEALRERVAGLERSEGEARAAEERMRAMAESTADYIIIVDRDGRIQHINRSFEPDKAAAIIGSCIFEYLTEPEEATVRACLDLVWESGEPSGYTAFYRDEVGEVVEFESRVTALTRDGRVDALLITSSDMTEERRGLVERDQFFDLSIDMFCIATRDGRFKNVSPAFQRNLGHSGAALVGRPMAELVHPEDRADMVANLEELGCGSGHVEFETRFRCADNQYKWLSWRVVLDCKLDLCYAVARDVTENRELENQLRQSQKMEAVGQLAGGIAHDFNNLVTAILMNAQRAQRDIDSAHPVYRRLEGIIDTCQRCAGLTNKLLTFSRDQVLRLRTLDIGSLAREIGELVRRVLPEHIHFTLAEPGELPPIRGDATQIEQIVVNLCVNARDAIPATGGHIQMDLSEVVLGEDACEGHPWITPGRFVRVSVTDDGSGMSPEVQERAFEPFYTTKQAGEGTGLGLATVYGIVKQHGGLVKLISEPDEGTRFEVYLPVSKRALGLSSPAIRLPSMSGSETLLIAEDERSLRTVLSEILQEAGYQVFVATDGREAVTLFEKHSRDIDLVVLDMIMPGMGGVEAYEWIANIRPGTPVLFCSGYSKFKLQRADRDDPVPRLLNKPYDIQQMLAAVRAVLDSLR